MTTASTKSSFKPYIIFLLVGLFLCFEMALQVSMSVITKNLMQDFSLSAAGVGFVTSFYYYSYTAMQIPAGVVFDRYNTKIIVSVSLIACIIGTLFLSLASSSYMIAVGRLLTGFGSAFAFVSVLYMAAQWFPNKHFALLAGLTMVLAAAGSIGGQAPLAFIIKHLGWRHAFIALAIAGNILLIMVLFFVEDPKHKLSFNDNQLPFKQSFLIILKNRQTWMIALYAFMIWTPITGFASLWGVSFISLAYHLSITTASIASSVIWLGIGLSSPLMGWLSSYIERRRALLIIVAFIGLLASFSVIYLPLSIAILFALLFCFGIGSAGQALSFAILKDNTPVQVTATAVGLNNAAVVASGFIVQPLIGHLLKVHGKHSMISGAPSYSLSSYHHALFLIPSAYLISMIIAFFFIKETYGKSKWS